MDKETLSNYGWVVICVLVLVVMIALATPFGEYIRNAFISGYEGFVDTHDIVYEIIPKSCHPFVWRGNVVVEGSFLGLRES